MAITKDKQDKDALKLYVERKAWQKICAFVDLCDTEISGLGRVEEFDGTYIVKDVAILEQEVSGAHATMDAKALSLFQEEMVKSGQSLKGWVFWWHSHVNMSAYFSGTDTGTMDTSTDFPFLISLVTNKRRDVQARIDIHKPARLFADMEVEILDDSNLEVIEECKQEIALKIKRPTYGQHMYSDRKAGYTTDNAKDDTQSWLNGYVKEGNIWVRRTPDAKILKLPEVPTREGQDGFDDAAYEAQWKGFEEDFWEQFMDMAEQIEFLEKQNGKKAKKALKKRRAQLADLVDYGQTHGIVITDQLLQGIMSEGYGE